MKNKGAPMPRVELTPSQVAFIKQNCLDSIHFLDQIMSRPEADERALPYLTERRVKFQQLYDDLCGVQGNVDARPADCRFRLKDEGKPYPRSGCRACGANLTTLGNYCRDVDRTKHVAPGHDSG
jgi:hypothetical protein